MNNKIIALSIGGVLSIGAFTGFAFAKGRTQAFASNNGQKAIPVSYQVESSSMQKNYDNSVKKLSVKNTQANAKAGSENVAAENQNNTDNSNNNFNNMINILKENGYQGMATAMQQGNYQYMNSFMSNLSDKDYNKMIDLMKENGYGEMAQAMESIGKQGMLQMHNAMRGAQANGGYGGMMGGF